VFPQLRTIALLCLNFLTYVHASLTPVHLYSSHTSTLHPLIVHHHLFYAMCALSAFSSMDQDQPIWHLCTLASDCLLHHLFVYLSSVQNGGVRICWNACKSNKTQQSWVVLLWFMFAV